RCPIATSSVSLLLFNPADPRRDLHSFPTRRSSDLTVRLDPVRSPLKPFDAEPLASVKLPFKVKLFELNSNTSTAVPEPPSCSVRSEEHTSELQSPCNLVCRLLLEKKNTIARLALLL